MNVGTRVVAVGSAPDVEFLIGLRGTVVPNLAPGGSYIHVTFDSGRKSLFNRHELRELTPIELLAEAGE